MWSAGAACINGEVVEAPENKNAYRTSLSEDTVGVLKMQKQKAGNSPWVFPHRRPISPRQRAPHAPPGAEAGRAAGAFHRICAITFATPGLAERAWMSRPCPAIASTLGFTRTPMHHVTTAAQREAVVIHDRGAMGFGHTTQLTMNLQLADVEDIFFALYLQRSEAVGLVINRPNCSICSLIAPYEVSLFSCLGHMIGGQCSSRSRPTDPLHFSYPLSNSLPAFRFMLSHSCW